MKFFQPPVHENIELAFRTIRQEPATGIPSWLIHPMDHHHIERLAGTELGSYRRDPESVYLAMQRKIGTCVLDQWIPRNPLSLGQAGYEHAAASATQGMDRIEVDGITIDSPEAVVEHMERFIFPQLQQAVAQFDEDAHAARIVEDEIAVQAILAPTMLKTSYGFVRFPGFAYGLYGYENYFMAYVLYPEVMERHFALSADLALCHNRAAARAFVEGRLPPIFRLDHDMADSRGTLVDVRSLDRLWFPHFARCLKPVLDAGVCLLWHCDGNLMEMVPRLIEAGVRGFQGFQYEDGMDYARICRMKSRDGRDLVIIAGVSVTRTLPYGTPEDVRRELRWLVDNGPQTGLMIAGSSSITPGVPWENMQALVEGLRHYRQYGRSGL